jgi:hypothetical protein
VIREACNTFSNDEKCVQTRSKTPEGRNRPIAKPWRMQGNIKMDIKGRAREAVGCIHLA